MVVTEVQRAEYEEMVKRGVSPKLAEMFALQQGPGLQTDTRFLHGRSENGFYSHQLQRWVSSRSDVKRICAEENRDCEGSVSHRSVWDKPRPDEKPYRVADDIVAEAVLDVLDDNPTALKDDPALPSRVRSRLEGEP